MSVLKNCLTLHVRSGIVKINRKEGLEKRPDLEGIEGFTQKQLRANIY